MLSTYDGSNRLTSVTDALGYTTAFTYNLATRTTTKTNPDGGIEVYQYNQNGDLLSETDPLGRLTTYTIDARYRRPVVKFLPNGLGTWRYGYDANGNRTSVIEPGLGIANAILATYDQFSNLTSVRDQLGRAATITIDATFLPISASDSLGQSGAFTWDPRGLPLSQTDANGQISRFTYDIYGNTLTETDPLGRVTTFTYDLLGRQATSTDPAGNTTRLGYDAFSRVISVTDPLNQVASFEYDGNGYRTAVIDALGRRTTSIYDAGDRLVQTTYPDGSTTRTTYDWRGNPVTQTDQSGSVTRSTYDLAGQLLTATVGDGTPEAATTTYAHDALGRQTDTTDPDGYTFTSSYNARGLLTESTDPDGQVTTYQHDATGNATQTTNPLGQTTTLTYDARGRVLATTLPNNSIVSQTYDPIGRLLSQTDPAGQVTQRTYDIAGRLTSVTNPVGGVTRYSYDANGNVSSLTDANNRVTSFLYDALDRQIRKTWPDGTYDQVTYDAVGNQLSHRAADGQVNTFSYDTMNRLRLATYFDGQTTNYDYTAIGQLQTVTESRGVTRYQYNARQQLSQITLPGGQLVSYGYTSAGRRNRLTTPAGTSVTNPNFRGQPTLVQLPSGRTIALEYDEIGNQTLRTATLPSGNRLASTRGYDTLNRLTLLSHALLDNAGAPIANLTSYRYTFDAVGNRVATLEADGASSAWSYDANRRLLAETQRNNLGSTIDQSSYSYDALGNRISQSVNGVNATSTYNNLDQRTTGSGSSFIYDGRGNLSQVTAGSSTTLYQWDARNRLVGVTRPTGTTIQYSYDHAGRRVSQTINGVTTNYLWDEASAFGDVVAETTSGGIVTATYGLAGDELVSLDRGGVLAFYLPDGQASVRALADSSGAITDTYRYGAYGERLNQSGATVNSYGYTGQATDSETGLIYLRSRYYDPSSGTFLSRDTAAVNRLDPAEFNRYAYGRQNPVSYADPSGHEGTSTTTPPGIRRPRLRLPPGSERRTGLTPRRWTAPTRGTPSGGGRLATNEWFTIVLNLTAQSLAVWEVAASVSFGLFLALMPQPQRNGAIASDVDDRDFPHTFYRGQTEYAGQEEFDFPSDIPNIIEPRQRDRQLLSGPGYYTSRNRDVASYFGNVNHNPFPGKGGFQGDMVAIIRIQTANKNWQRLTASWGTNIRDNNPLDPRAQKDLAFYGYQPPYVETVFSFPAAADLLATSSTTIEFEPRRGSR